MIEKIILDYLTEQLEDPVLMEKPSPPPARYYLLQKVGSGLQDTICQAGLVLKSHAPTMFEAAQMNELGKAAMLAADALPEVSKVDLNTDHEDTDTASKGYRYRAMFDITHY